MNNMQAIKNLISENSEYNDVIAEAQIYANKWEKTKLLEGLSPEWKIKNAILLENQARQLVKESTNTSTSPGGEEWSGVALPLVRRVLDNMSAKELVAVQPMTLPTGLVFFLDFIETGTGKSIYGETRNVVPNGGFYGGRHSYSDGSIKETITDITVATPFASIADAKIADVNYNSKQDLTGLKTVVIEITPAVKDRMQLANIKDTKLIKSVDANGNITALFDNLSQYTKFIEDYKLKFVVDASYTADAVGIQAMTLTATTRTGRFEDFRGVDLHIPEIEMKLSQEPITAKLRKLKAVFSNEIQQDLQAYHAIDANAELTKMLADKISAEIDIEILSMLVNGADRSNIEYWSAAPGAEWDVASQSFKDDLYPYAINNKTDWYRSLGTKIRKVSNMIYKKTLLGGANFAVVSPEVATVMESIPGFTVTNNTFKHLSFGVQEIGMLNNEIVVYKNPYWTTNVMLLGHKGAGSLDTGAVYAPYIPLLISPLVYDANNFTPRKGISSRYATKLLKPEFYGLIYIAGLETV